MATIAKVRPWRSLFALLAITAGLAVWALWPGQANTPRLGLDLQGGTQVILTPQQAEGTADITDEQLQQTVEIIRQRVNGFGVAEADVAIQGSGNDAAIVVSVPGVNERQLAEQLSQTALLDFRPVETVVNPGPIDTSAQQGGGDGEQSGTQNNRRNQRNSDGGGAEGNASFETTPSPAPADASPAPADASPAPADASPSPEQTAPADDGITPPVEGDSATDPVLEDALIKLDCTDPANRQGGRPDNPEKWIVTCDQDGTAKFLLQPAFIKGTSITNASAGLAQGGSGWVVNLEFDGEGTQALSEVSNRLVSLPSPQNQFGIVLDGLVVSAPFFQQAINDGRAQISGSFTPEEAKALAQVLKFGALPLTLQIASVETVTPTLGADYLQVGLIAGAVGLFLVVLYLLAYYRALGMVAVASLIIAAVITYLVFVVLSRTVGLALTLAGVAGAIVAIGITADSFVVYFERIRDEVREGRSLRAACDAGWSRARNTILAADFVSLLAALVLYFLSVGAVRGFAFVLGLTTVIDVMVAFLFTRPMVTLLARNKWFTSGHPMTGLDPRRLGVRPETLQGQPRRREEVDV